MFAILVWIWHWQKNSDLAEMFFGQGDKAAVQKYVNEVFDKFDYDHSGELSYEGLHLSGSYLTSMTSSAPLVVQTTF